MAFGGLGSGGFAAFGEGYMDYEKQLQEMLKQRLEMQKLQQDMGPMDPRVADAFGLGGGGSGFPSSAGGAPSVSPAGAPSGPGELYPGERPTIGGYPTQQVLRALAGGEAKSYSELGPMTRHGRALGLYQVMPDNLREWSKQYLGREVSPEEYLRSPELQDRLAAARFGAYADKGGLPYAAGSWLGWGPRGDVYGTTAGPYAQRFMSRLGQPQAGGPRPPMGPQVASAGPGLPQGAVPGAAPIAPPGTPPTGEIRAPTSGLPGMMTAAVPPGAAPGGGRLTRDMDRAAAAVGVPPPAAAAPAPAAPPRAAGMRPPEEVARRLLAIPGMNMTRFQKYMDDYNKMYGAQERTDIAEQRQKLAEDKAKAQEEQFKERQAELDKRAAAAEAGKEKRSEAALKGRRELQEERLKAGAEAREEKVKTDLEKQFRDQQFKNQLEDKREAARKEIAQLRITTGSEPTIDDDTAERFANDVIQGKAKLVQDQLKGGGKAAAANWGKIENLATKMMKEQGLSQEEIDSRMLDLQGKQKAIQTAEANYGRLSSATTRLEGAAKVLQEKLADADAITPLSRFPSLNAYYNATVEQLGSEEAVRRREAVRNAATTLSSVIRGGYQPTDQSYKQGEQIFNPNFSTDQLRAALETTMETARQEVRSSQESINRLTGMKEKPPVPDDDPRIKQVQDLGRSGIAPQKIGEVIGAARDKDGNPLYTPAQIDYLKQKASEAHDEQLKKRGLKEPLGGKEDVKDIGSENLTKTLDTLLKNAKKVQEQGGADPSQLSGPINKAGARLITPPGGWGAVPGELRSMLQRLNLANYLQPPPGGQGLGRTNYGGVE